MCSASSHTARVAFGKNAGPGAQQLLVSRERALVVPHRRPRKEVDRHAFTLTPQPQSSGNLAPAGAAMTPPATRRGRLPMPRQPEPRNGASTGTHPAYGPATRQANAVILVQTAAQQLDLAGR